MKKYIGFLVVLSILVFGVSGAQALVRVNTTTKSFDRPSILVVSPNGGEIYQGGQQVSVEWKSYNLSVNSSVQIVLQDLGGALSGFPITLSASTPNDGQENIILPTGFGRSFKIEVSVPGGADPFVGDVSDDVFSIVPIAPISCDAQVKVAFSYEDTSPDGIQANITNKEQGIVRMWLYSPCNISIGGLNTSPFGPWTDPSVGTNYTFWGANRFSQFSAYKGYGNDVTTLPLLGTTVFGGIGITGSDIIFDEPLQLSAGVPQMITIGGKLKPINEVTGVVLDKAQFCVVEPSNVEDANGNIISIQALNYGGATGNFMGRFTCGDIFYIN